MVLDSRQWNAHYGRNVLTEYGPRYRSSVAITSPHAWEVVEHRLPHRPVHVEFLPAVDPEEFLPNDTKGLAHRLRETIRRAREAEQVA